MQNRRTFIKTGAVATLTAGFARSLYAKEKKVEKYAREYQCDVCVVGAGPAGIPAAIAAARQGMKVVLIHDDAIIGGAPVSMYADMVCGGPLVGIHYEMFKKAFKDYDIRRTPNRKDGDWLWLCPYGIAASYNALIRAEKNITLIANAYARGVIMDEKGNKPKILGVEYSVNGNVSAVRAKVVIDSTGTGLISDLAGAKYMFGREAKSDFNEALALDVADNKVMPCTWMGITQRFRPGGVLDMEQTKVPLNEILESGVGYIHSLKAQKKEVPMSDIYLQWMTQDFCNTLDPTEIANLQSLLLERDIMPMMENFHSQGFSINIAPRLGIRECRRVLGHKVITTNEVCGEVFPDDTIAVAKYILDAWGRRKELGSALGKEYTFGIPYSACVVKDVENLLMAGKHISGTSMAASAYRVQPIVASIGQAVGNAAAMMIENNTSAMSIGIEDLQSKLIEQKTLKRENLS